jgi:hypothetical protein
MGTSVPERVLTWESRDGGEVIAAERHIGNPGRTVLSTPWGYWIAALEPTGRS